MKFKLGNKGSTMVEVIVAFVVLLIIVAGLSQIIRLSSNMHMNTIDEINEQKVYQESYYTDKNLTKHNRKVKENVVVSFSEIDASGEKISNGAAFELQKVKEFEITENESDEDKSVYIIGYWKS